MKHFDDRVTDHGIHLEDVRSHVQRGDAGGLFLGRYRVTATSGSSGRPGCSLFGAPGWRAGAASVARGQGATCEGVPATWGTRGR